MLASCLIPALASTITLFLNVTVMALAEGVKSTFCAQWEHNPHTDNLSSSVQKEEITSLS